MEEGVQPDNTYNATFKIYTHGGVTSHVIMSVLCESPLGVSPVQYC